MLPNYHFFLNQPFPKQALVLARLKYKYFETTVGTGEIARNEQFLLFPQCFLPVWENFLPFLSSLKLSSAYTVSLEESKICCLEKIWIYHSTSDPLSTTNL